jgi:hypothetical protein
MRPDRHIPDEVIDALVEWCYVHAPCVIDVPAFMHGLFVITDDAIREAVEAERERLGRFLRRGSEN